MSASGKVLATPLQQLATKGIAEFNQLPESDRKPPVLGASSWDAHGRPSAPPAGYLAARVYIRALLRDEKGELRRDEVQSKKYFGPNRDFFWLSESEWRSLVPANPREGQKFAVPEAVARRIILFHLLDATTSIANRPWPPEQRRSADLTLTVEAVSAAAIRLRLDGKVRLADHADFAQAQRRGDFRLMGALNYDVAAKAFDRFDVVALADDYLNAHISEYLQQVGQKNRFALGIAFELARPGSLGYGTPPATVRDADRGQLLGYFGTDKDPAVLRYFGKEK